MSDVRFEDSAIFCVEQREKLGRVDITEGCHTGLDPVSFSNCIKKVRLKLGTEE